MTVTLGTLLIQGLTPRPLALALCLCDDEDTVGREVHAARLAAADETCTTPAFAIGLSCEMHGARPAWLSAVATLRALGRRWDAQTSRASSADTASNGGE
jgi:hypothetical protein